MKHVLIPVLTLVALAAVAAAPSAPESPAAAVARVGATWLTRDAWATHARHVQATRTSAGEIAPEFWGDALKELKPLRVYSHQVNVVAVLSAEEQTEEGLYLCTPFSSYIPRNGTDGFEFTPLAGGLMAYRRGRSDPSPSHAHHFRLFMPREDVYNGTPDVSARIERYLQAPAADIPLAAHPILSDEDLVAYDWSSHTLILARTFWHKIRRPSLRGSPFVVVADGQPVYVGAFVSDLSSFSCPVPVIRFDERLTNAVVRLDRAYPADSAAQGLADPRADGRLKIALQALGKLRE